jgi:hypothetical protein
MFRKITIVFSKQLQAVLQSPSGHGGARGLAEGLAFVGTTLSPKSKVFRWQTQENQRTFTWALIRETHRVETFLDIEESNGDVCVEARLYHRGKGNPFLITKFRARGNDGFDQIFQKNT